MFWSKKLLMNDSTPKILPTSWGKITSAGVSRVETASGNQVVGRCLTLVTTTGAVAVAFPEANIVPTKEQILSSYFVAGSFASTFDSGYWPTSVTNNNTQRGYPTDKLCPAIWKRLSERAAWYDNSICIRNIRGSQDKFNTPPGYSFAVNNGILTIKYNDEIVLELK